MSPEIAKRAADYLNALPNKCFRNAVPVKVTFKLGEREWSLFGARSEQVQTCQKGDRYETDLGMTPGQEYLRTRFDIVGKRPEPLRKQKRNDGCKYVYRIDGDDGDWFCGGYYQGGVTSYHPFGSWYSIHRWDHEHPWMGRIDQFDEKPCERVQMLVELL